MTRDESKAVLHCPHRALVLAALTYVNLTYQEQDILIARHMHGQTQEELAADAGYSVNGLQKIEYRALDKCAAVWGKMAIAREILALDANAEK